MLKCLLFLMVGFICISSSQAQVNTLLALNKNEATLAIIDADTMKVRGRVPVGNGPHEVVFSADGKLAFVANYGAQSPGSSISVIHVAQMKELRRVELAPLMRPHGLVVLGGKLYFTAEVNRAIARYDPTENKLDWLMGTGQNGSHMIVLTPDQRRIYTTNIGSDTITAFEFNAVPPSGSKVTHVAVGKQPEAIDLSPDGREVWVGLNVDGGVDIVDTTSLKVTERVKLGSRPYRVRFTPDGKQVLFTLLGTKEISLYDSATRKELRKLAIPSVPMGVTFTPDGKTAFVSVAQPDAVVKVDLEKMTIVGSVESGSAPDGVAYFGK
jgi:YVTN family beta-propeller protein